MKPEPEVGIILANWNGAQYLDEAIRSVVAQSYPCWRLICVDTGSADSSQQKLRQWAATDSRIQLMSIANRLNYPAAINVGLANLQTPLVARIESDDIWEVEKLRRQVAFLEAPANAKIGVSGCDAILIDSRGRAKGVKRFPRSHADCLRAIWYRNPFCHSSVLLRREVLETCGGYDASRYLVEDLDLWFRAARRWRLANLPTPLVSYRLWSGSLTSRRLVAIAWRGYTMRAWWAPRYGYRCPFLARAYGLASLAASLLPAPMVLSMFCWSLKVLGPAEVPNETGALERDWPEKPAQELVADARTHAS